MWLRFYMRVGEPVLPHFLIFHNSYWTHEHHWESTIGDFVFTFFLCCPWRQLYMLRPFLSTHSFQWSTNTFKVTPSCVAPLKHWAPGPLHLELSTSWSKQEPMSKGAMGTGKLSCPPQPPLQGTLPRMDIWVLSGKMSRGLADAERIQVSSEALRGWRAPNPHLFPADHSSGTTAGLNRQG